MSTTPCTPVPCTPVPCTPFDPCTCAPGLDKEIIFNEATCMSADPRFLWDYTDGLLSVNGAIAASGYIGSSSQLEGAYLAPQALGTGAISFTPPAGYGGFVYRGGSVFYYWNNANNAWEEIDFAGEVVSSQINIAHNGVILGAVTEMNFQDSSTGTWTISTTGNVAIALSNVWQGNVNAGGFGLSNLATLNGVPVISYLTNPLTQNINGNNFFITGLSNLTTAAGTVNGNLTVTGEIYYKGLPLEAQLGNDLWTLNADGSITRNSNVYISGAWSGGFGPLTVNSTVPNNYLNLNTTGSPASGNFCAFAAYFNNTYGGEIGFSTTNVEIWAGNTLAFQANVGGPTYIAGNLGIGNPSPAYMADIGGSANVTGCYYITGVPFACLTPGGGAINLSNINTINGASPGGAQTPWQQNINGNGFQLNGAYSVSVLTGMSAAQNYSCGGAVFCTANAVSGVDLTNVDTINGAPYPPTVGTGTPQTPWLQNINAANFNLSNLRALGIGTNASSTAGTILVSGSSGNTVIQMTDVTAVGYVALIMNASSASCQLAVWGSGAGPSSNMVQLNNTAGPIGFGTVGTQRMLITATGNIGIANSSPVYALDVSGDVNASNCFRIAGIGFACPTGTGTVNLSDIATINGAPYTSGGQPQTPWAQNINAAGFTLGPVGALSVGTVGPGVAGVIGLSVQGAFSNHTISCVNNLQTAECDILFSNNANGTSLKVGVAGIGSSDFPGQPSINVTGTNAPLIIAENFNEVARFMAGPKVGIGQPNPGYALDVTGGVNATGCYVSNGVQFACWAGTNAVQLENISTINGAPVGGGPTTGNDEGGNRVFSTVYQNTLGRALYVNITFNFSAVANESVIVQISANGTGWYNVAAAQVNQGNGITEKTVSFIVPPGWYYSALPAGASSIVEWFEWN